MSRITRLAGTCAVFALAAPAAVAAQTSSPVTLAAVAAPTREDTARAVHLLNRATWGVRAGDIDAVLAHGPAGWLERQLAPHTIADDDLVARLNAFPTASLGMAELYRDFAPRPADVLQRQQMQALRDSLGDARMLQQMTAEQRRERAARNPARLLTDLVGAKIQRAVYAERQLEDVMADFWFNHFNVFFGKGQDRYLTGDYERTAIRPHVFGRFEDMLVATAQHPAMLFYLDNWQSVHVDTQRLALALRQRPQLMERTRMRGLNENYARELLELHTLGVDGGYTQEDVIDVARAFTGWTFQPYNVNRQQGDVRFVFRPELHDRGAKVVLGRPLRAGRGIEDGMDVIRMLSRHPETARHIATKLVERFVADEPPADLVEHVAQTFLQTDGDLRAVTRALFTADAFYRPDYRAAKVKTPYELVVSALRATNAEVRSSQRTIATLRTMGHLPYTEPAPTGFPAMSEDWVNTGAMLNRMNFGLELAAGRIDGVRVGPALAGPAARTGDGRGATAVAAPGAAADGAPLDALLRSVLPGVDTRQLAQRIREDAAAQTAAAPRQRLARALGLALGSPEFQRR